MAPPNMMDWICKFGQWHQPDNHASTSSVNFFAGWMLFLMPNEQCQSTECIIIMLLLHHSFVKKEE